MSRTPRARRLTVLLALALALAFCWFGPVVGANQDNSINFTEIRQQALFAVAAYRSEAENRKQFEGSGFSLTLQRTVPGIEIVFLLATDEIARRQVIAVRGTVNEENAMLDLALKLRPDERSGIVLHEGFAHAAEKIYAEIQPMLKPGFEISATGHSLGGAVATILALYLDIDGLRVGRTVTFGQPKITNVAGAARIGELEVLRVVEPDDLVPLVPLIDPLDINNVDIYWHAGQEVVLLEATRYALLEGASSMMRATKFTQKPLTEEHLHKHDMATYLALIDARTAGAELVPYATDLNLFNLFGSE